MKKVKRLAQEFLPAHYDLYLAPNPENMTFSGRVRISGQRKGRPSQRLTLHQKNLKITRATVTKKDRRHGKIDIPITRVNRHDKFDEVRLHADQLLYPGEYEIELEFSGTITDQMHGVYPCYFKHDGQDKKIIATQFESHYAREVFPCIDEPEAKAVFDLSLLTPADDTVLSNTPIKKQQVKKNGGQADAALTIFETTPKMSTYLLAFAFGEMNYRESKTKDGVSVRAYATPDNARFTDFAVETAVKCLEFYNDYFDIDYPLPKLDMVALPDFSAGAMENWGLVTYREQALLVDPANTPLEMKQYVAMVIAHELAHQWFGNLVTMSWWTDLWLNEGFASWIEYLACAKLFPQWHMWTQYVVEDQLIGLRSDALVNTHPVEVPINHPDEIRTIFDEISYQKGSAVIHMLQAYLGAEHFRDGLRHYLKAHAYGNTQTDDLWAALARVSGKPVREFMHAWIGEAGYPLLKVKKNEGELRLSQRRFFASAEADHRSETVWQIPMNCPELNQVDSLNDREIKIDWKNPAPFFNHGHSGFYLTVYDAEAYRAFGSMIEKASLSETERLGLLFDSFAAARAGYLSTKQALDLLTFYHAEHSAPVWDTISMVLADIRRVFDDDKLIESMKPYLRDITAEQVKRLGWIGAKNEPYFDTLLRPTVLGLASLGKNELVVGEALSMFAKMRRPEDEAPDLRGVIYATAVRSGGRREFVKLKKFYEQTNSATEKVILSSALCAFKQPELYEEALAIIKSPLVRAQDVSYWVAYSFSNRHAKHSAWKWMMKNWDWLEENLGAELGFARLPTYAARSFADEKFKKEFSDFFEPRLTPAVTREYRKGLETIDWQSAWRRRDAAAIMNFFGKFS